MTRFRTNSTRIIIRSSGICKNWPLYLLRVVLPDHLLLQLRYVSVVQSQGQVDETKQHGNLRICEGELQTIASDFEPRDGQRFRRDRLCGIKPCRVDVERATVELQKKLQGSREVSFDLTLIIHQRFLIRLDFAR